LRLWTKRVVGGSELIFAALALLNAGGMSSLAAGSKPASDPRAIMKLAAKINGLSGLNAQPWEVKVSFKALGEKGYLLDEGTYEETWISPIKFKRTLIGATHTLSEFGTAQGTLRSGDKWKSSVTLNDMHLAMLNPLPADIFIKLSEARGESRNVAGVQCRCVDLYQHPSPRATETKPGYSYCFDAKGILLQATMAAWDNTQYVLTNSIQFQGRWVPSDIEVWNQGVLVLTAHLESIDILKEADKVEFKIPTDAAFQSKTINYTPGKFHYGVNIKKVAPFYRRSAYESGIEGTVVLQGVISKEGRVKELIAVSGPQSLQQAAIDAVKQWEYEPWILDGAPIEVETTLEVPFSLADISPAIRK
jgi:TonB family protein